LVSVKKSVTQSSGESDLELTWERPDKSHAILLIENKVDAAFQRDQAIRYRERAAVYVASGRYSSAWTLLIAPSAYFGSDPSEHGFDSALRYETLQEWFGQESDDPRGLYRIGILQAAINKATKGYNPIEDDSITRFWHDYWLTCTELAPELGMAKPGPKPANSNWIKFAPGGLPRGMSITHKVMPGLVDLTFSGTGEQLGELSTLLRPILEAGMHVERTGKSSSVRLLVPALSMARSLDEQRDGVLEALEAAKRILAWTKQHRLELEAAAGQA